MIYCVWYPSGGFGHFINAILTLYGKDFKRPKTDQLTFSHTGDSHSLDLVVPKYSNYNAKACREFESQYNYCQLIDLGINHSSKQFMLDFPTAEFIKLCYSDISWPLVAHAMFTKAMASTVAREVVPESMAWKSQEPWVKREKYFLFLRDHELRRAWRPDPDMQNIMVDNILDYDKLKTCIEQIGICVDDFKPLWSQWFDKNSKYIKPVLEAQQIINDLRNNSRRTLTHITDIWNQAVIYYFIWLEFGVEVPHNDFSNFFHSIDHIRTCLTP